MTEGSTTDLSDEIASVPHEAHVLDEHYLEIVRSFAESLADETPLEDLLWTLVRDLAACLGVDDIVLSLSEGHMLRQVAAFGPKSPEFRRLYRPKAIPVTHGIVGTVAAQGFGESVEDTHLDPRFLPDVIPGQPPVRSLIAVPIVSGNEVIGVVRSTNPEPSAFSAEQFALCQTLCAVAAPRLAHALEQQTRLSIERELERSRNELADRVDHRTAELRNTVWRLRDEVAARRRVQNDLVREGRRRAATLRALGEGLLATNARGRILEASDAACRILGLPRESVIGRLIEEVYLPCTQPTQHEALGKPTERLDQGERPRSLFLLQADGRWLEIDESVTQVPEGPDGESGAVVVFSDQTESRRLEREAQKVQKLEALGLLAGGIAHDFNNLLTGILGHIELTKMSEELEDLEPAFQACHRAKRLTGQLLTFAEGGSPVREVRSLPELLRETVKFVLSGSSCAWTLDCADDLHMVAVDPTQFSQVVQNLALNAVQAMGGKGSLQIRTFNSSVDDEDSVVIEVEDSGPGVPPEVAARIFDPWFTTKSDGTGLGLSTSFSICRGHGGNLELLTGQDGRGALFRITIPAAKGAEAQQEGLEAGLPERTLRILVLDDEEMLRRSLARLLQSIGHEPTTCSSTDEAVIEHARAMREGKPYDLAIFDLTMPGDPGGIEALRRIREFNPAIAAIVSSGYSDNTTLSEPSSFGFDGRLNKPFDLKDLLTALAKCPKEHIVAEES